MHALEEVWGGLGLRVWSVSCGRYAVGFRVKVCCWAKPFWLFLPVQVKARRVRRGPGASGRDSAEPSAPQSDAFDPAVEELPAALVKGLLAEKYEAKWARLGVQQGVQQAEASHPGGTAGGLVNDSVFVSAAIRPPPDDRSSSRSSIRRE